MTHGILLHATHHLLLTSHRLERHGLEPSLRGWLLHCAESVCIRLMLLLLGRSAHHIGEGVCTTNLLCLELVWLLATWLLFLVKALEHGQFISVGDFGRMRSQRLIALSKNISKRVTWCLSAITSSLRCISCENVE